MECLVATKKTKINDAGKKNTNLVRMLMHAYDKTNIIMYTMTY